MLLGACGGSEAPAVLTVGPTPTPTPVPPHEAGYVSIPWGGGLDAIFVPTPTPQAPPSAAAESVSGVPVRESAPVYDPASSVEFAFLNGWHDAGGGLFKTDAQVVRFVQCESTWRVVTEGFHLSLTQFAPSTWGHVAAITGLWNVYDPYEHGYNAAVWASLSDPYQQWPVCFWK